MATLFDLERDVEIVKRKTEKGLVESKGLARSRSNGSSNNRLLALEQGLFSPTWSSAYETQTARPTIPQKLYLIAGGRKGDWEKLGARTQEALTSLQRDMVCLLPEFWKESAREPNAKTIANHCKVIRKEFEAGGFGESNIYLNKSFISQVLFWAAVLKEAIDEVFFYSSYIDDSNLFKELIKKEMGTKALTVNPLAITNLVKSKLALAEIENPTDFYTNLAEKVVKELVGKELVSAVKNIAKDKKVPTLTVNLLAVKDLDKEFQMHKMHENSPAYKVAENETGLIVSPADRERFRQEQKGFAELAQNSSFVDIGTPSEDVNKDIAKNLQAILNIALTIPKKIQFQKASLTQFKNYEDRVAKILSQLQISLSSIAYCDASEDLRLNSTKLRKAKEFLEKENEDGLVSTLVSTIDASYVTWDGKNFAVTGNQLQNLNTTHTTKNFLTVSNWGGAIPALLTTCLTISGLVYKIGKKDWAGIAKKLKPEHPVSATSKVIGTIKKGLDAATAVDGLSKGKVLAKHTAENIGKVSGIAGIVLGVVELGYVAKDIKNIYSLETRFKALIEKTNSNKLKTLLNANIVKGAKRHRINNQRYKAFDKILQKYGHRTHYKVISGVGAVFSIVSGSLTTAIAFGAAVGVANIWNPVGWVCIGATLVTGVGLLSYKGVKKITYKKYKLNKLNKQYNDVPGFCKTSGDYWRYKAATTIFIASIMEDEDVLLLNDDLKKDIAVGRAFAIVLFGAAIKNEANRKKASAKAYQTAAQMGIPGIMAFIKG